MKFKYTSPYLLITLDYGKGDKINYSDYKITFGENIYFNNEFSDKTTSNTYYELIAISVQSGYSLYQNDYKTYCKVTFEENENIWYEFNDHDVAGVDFKKVKKHNEYPFLLIFKKK